MTISLSAVPEDRRSTTAVRPARRGEIRALTGLRIVAALWVLAFHLQGGLSPFQPYLQPVWPLIRAGWLGVDLFFVLSGFVMTLTYLETMGPRVSPHRLASFMWARLSRVWPLWALLTCLYAGWLAWSNYDAAADPQRARPVTILHLLDQLAMVQMWHREQLWGASFVTPGWSLSVEFFAYACFPVLVLVLWRLRRLPASVLAAGAVAAMLPMAYVAYRTGMADWELSWLMRIGGAFVSGALVCLFVRKMERSFFFARVAPFLAALSVVEILIVCWWASWRSGGDGGDHYGVAAPAFPVLVAALALSKTGLAKFLSRETMVMGGKISFALYLVHTCVLEIGGWVAEHIPQLQPGGPLWAVMQPQLVLISLGLAYLGWRFVEEPARKWMRRVGPQDSKRGVVSTGGRHYVSVGQAELLPIPEIPARAPAAEPATVRMLVPAGDPR